MRPFFDTNVLIYAYSRDVRRERSIDLLAADGVISVQSLAEFAHVGRRKLGLAADTLAEAIQLLSEELMVSGSLTLDVLQRGLVLSRRYNLSIFDCTLIAVALDAECDEFLSEDLHHGLVIEGRLTVRNPFLPN